MPFEIRDSAAASIAFTNGSTTFTTSVNRRDSLRFSWIGTGSLPLDVGDEVFVHDGTSNIFGGTVQSIAEEDLLVNSTDHRKADFLCVSFDELAGRRLLAESYTDTTAGAIVTDLITDILGDEGITAGTIEAGAVITKAVFNYMTCDRVLDELAQLSGGFIWWITPAKVLNFREQSSQAAPWSLTSGNEDYRRLKITRNRSDYRNVQYIRAGIDLTDAAAETFVGDGTRRTFNVQYPVGATPTIEVDTGGGYTTKTVGVNGVDSGVQFFYNIGRTEITQASSETVLSSAHNLRVTYQGQVPIIALREDGDKITERSTAEANSSGRYERIDEDRSIDDADDAITKANALISRYGEFPVVVDFLTDTTGLEAGQLLTVNLSGYDLNDTFLIEQVVAREGGDLELEYNVRAVSNQADGGWLRYFRTLQAQSRTFVIRENETLAVIRAAPDDFTVADSPSTATSTSSGTTVDNAAAIVGLIDVG